MPWIDTLTGASLYIDETDDGDGESIGPTPILISPYRHTLSEQAIREYLNIMDREMSIQEEEEEEEAEERIKKSPLSKIVDKYSEEDLNY